MPRIIYTAFLCLFAASVYAQSARVSFVSPVSLFGYAGGVGIEWEVYDDEAVDYYVILKRSNGMDRAIATVTPERESQEATVRYRHIDAHGSAPRTAYRLRAVFEDQSFAESDWLDAGSATGTRERILSALDEESIARLHIRVSSPQHQDVTVKIKTLAGEELDSYPRALVAGENVLEVDYRSWPSGYYTVEIGDDADVDEWLVHVDAQRTRARSRRLPNTH